METNKKLGYGSALAVLGVAGIILGYFLGAGNLGRPWSFILGFVFGVASGSGVVLSISGLFELRRMQ